MTSEDHHLPETYVTVQDITPILPDHCVLYEAKSAAEMGEPGWIGDDGGINMMTIATYCGDFNGRDMASYWTPEAETAEKYRAWTSRRCPWSDIWVMRIQLPTTFIKSLRQQQLCNSRGWKEYVWDRRKHQYPPAKYDAYWRPGGADIITGHICKSATTPVARIKKADIQNIHERGESPHNRLPQSYPVGVCAI